jgi:hypothetical protein
MVTGLLILTVMMALGYCIVCWVQDPFYSGEDDDDGSDA